jgi:hypothetical protein
MMDTLGLDRQPFLRFYGENVVARENDEPECVARDAWMKAMRRWRRTSRRTRAAS